MTSTLEDRLSLKIRSDAYFGEGVRFVLAKLGDLTGRIVVESGCGDGHMSVFFALHGARVIGLDINREALAKARDLAQRLGVEDRCCFLMGCAEACPIDTASVDVVFSKSTIQYMDRDKALGEYVRILKPDGRLALLENLPHNPFINLYRLHRRLTARNREQRRYVESIKGYLTSRDVLGLKARFHHVEQRHQHLFRMITIHCVEKHPGNVTKRLDIAISQLDEWLLSRLAILRRLAWFTAIYCERPRAVLARVAGREAARGPTIGGSWTAAPASSLTPSAGHEPRPSDGTEPPAVGSW